MTGPRDRLLDDPGVEEVVVPTAGVSFVGEDGRARPAERRAAKDEELRRVLGRMLARRRRSAGEDQAPEGLGA